MTTGLRLDRLDIYHYDGHDMTLAKRLPLAVMPSHMAFTCAGSGKYATTAQRPQVRVGLGE